MAKIVDITDKLSFDENPSLVIRGERFEVNADAPTMLRIMGLFNTTNEAEAIPAAYQLLFNDNARAKIDSMRLSFKDFSYVIETAMNLIRGEDMNPGEDQTHTMI